MCQNVLSLAVQNLVLFPFCVLGHDTAVITQRGLGKNVLGYIGSDAWEEGGRPLYKVKVTAVC